MSIIATEPQGYVEQWDIFERGEWKLLQDGEVIISGKVGVPEHKKEAQMVAPNPSLHLKS